MNLAPCTQTCLNTGKNLIYFYVLCNFGLLVWVSGNFCTFPCTVGFVCDVCILSLISLLLFDGDKMSNKNVLFISFEHQRMSYD